MQIYLSYARFFLSNYFEIQFDLASLISLKFNSAMLI